MMWWFKPAHMGLQVCLSPHPCSKYRDQERSRFPPLLPGEWSHIAACGITRSGRTSAMENDASHEGGSSGGQRQTFPPCGVQGDTKKVTILHIHLNKHLIVTSNYYNCTCNFHYYLQCIIHSLTSRSSRVSQFGRCRVCLGWCETGDDKTVWQAGPQVCAGCLSSDTHSRLYTTYTYTQTGHLSTMVNFTRNWLLNTEVTW